LMRILGNGGIWFTTEQLAWCLHYWRYPRLSSDCICGISTSAATWSICLTISSSASDVHMCNIGTSLTFTSNPDHFRRLPGRLRRTGSQIS
jgi:hypothetical protein